MKACRPLGVDSSPMKDCLVGQRICRRLVLLTYPTFFWRAALLRLRGAKIGRGTRISPRTVATWPHQIRLGDNCVLQPDIFFNYDHFWTPGPSMIFGQRVFIGRGVEFNIRGRMEVGDDTQIASHCVFVDHDHGMRFDVPMNMQAIRPEPITIGRNARIGARTVVLKGIEVGECAVIRAGSVLTRSVPAGEVWAGVPARPVHTAAAQ